MLGGANTRLQIFPFKFLSLLLRAALTSHSPSGEKTRAEGECKLPIIPGKQRCKFPGGITARPKSPEGRERTAAVRKRRWIGAEVRDPNSLSF